MLFPIPKEAWRSFPGKGVGKPNARLLVGKSLAKGSIVGLRKIVQVNERRLGIRTVEK